MTKNDIFCADADKGNLNYPQFITKPHFLRSSASQAWTTNDAPVSVSMLCAWLLGYSRSREILRDFIFGFAGCIAHENKNARPRKANEASPWESLPIRRHFEDSRFASTRDFAVKNSVR